MGINNPNQVEIVEETDDMEMVIEGLSQPQPVLGKTTAQLVDEISADIEAHFKSVQGK